MTHRAWIAISGLIWLGIGSYLLYKGLLLIAEGTARPETLCFHMKGMFGSPEQAGTALIGMALLVGFLKGRFVLAKTVRRVSMRILSLSSPIRVSSVYAPSYYLLIGFMVALGLSMRFLPIPVDLRGFIDAAVGSALINGAMLYFRAARGALRVHL